MARTTWPLLLGLLLAFPDKPRAADKKPLDHKTAGKGPVGTYKFVALLPNSEVPLYLLKMDNKEGKWGVSVVAANAEAAPKVSGIEDASAEAGHFMFDLKLDFPNQRGGVVTQVWNIEGLLPKDKSKTLRGSIRRPGNQFFLARFEPTKLKQLDSFALGKEALPDQSNYKACMTVQTLLGQAKTKKATAEEIEAWARKAYTIAGRYGPRFQESIARSLAQTLDFQGIEPELALEYGLKLEKLMSDKEPVASQIRTLEFVIGLLEKAKKTTEIKEYRARIAKLRSRTQEDDLKKALTFKPATYGGRKGKSTRVVLVEAFTGAQCDLCPATDIALNGVGRTYKPTDVVVLEYHLSFPGPDALSNGQTKKRFKYYFDQADGTPAVFFNGKVGAAGGGQAADAEDKYRDFRDIIDPLLEKSTNVKLTARADRKGDDITIKAEVYGLARPGNNLRLRLALVEGWVRYTGKNRQNFHLYVVRDMPGGAAGFPLTTKNNKLTATVNLEMLRSKLNTYLDDFAKHYPFPDEQRPLDFKSLHVVAFVQNDTTREVLQAAQVKVVGKETVKEKADDNEETKEKEKKKDKKKMSQDD
jgi:hypothetical protein